MKKGNFNIKILHPNGRITTQTETGYTSKHFGLATGSCEFHVVTHLETGAIVYTFPLIKYARYFIALCEKANFLIHVQNVITDRKSADVDTLRRLVGQTHKHFA